MIAPVRNAPLGPTIGIFTKPAPTTRLPTVGNSTPLTAALPAIVSLLLATTSRVSVEPVLPLMSSACLFSCRIPFDRMFRNYAYLQFDSRIAAHLQRECRNVFGQKLKNFWHGLFQIHGDLVQSLHDQTTVQRIQTRQEFLRMLSLDPPCT